MIIISAFYLAINALITVTLSMLVVRYRLKHRVLLGDGNQPELIRATRAFGNNVEYFPIMMLLSVAMEMMHAPSWFLHVLLISYTLGRIFHALVIYQVLKHPTRIVGMMLTYTPIIITSCSLLILVARSR